MFGLSSDFTIKHFNINKLILKLGLFDTQNYDFEIILHKKKKS